MAKRNSQEYTNPFKFFANKDKLDKDEQQLVDGMIREMVDTFYNKFSGDAGIKRRVEKEIIRRLWQERQDNEERLTKDDDDSE